MVQTTAAHGGESSMNGSTDPSTPVEQAPQTGVDTGAPVPVAMEYVESQLMELWRDVAEAAQASGGAQSVTTAQVLNLIVHAESYQQASSIVPTIDRISSDLPAMPRLDSAGKLSFRFGGRIRVSENSDGDFRGELPITVKYL